MDQVSGRPLRRRQLEFRSVTEGAGALIFARDTGRYLFLLRSTKSWENTWGLPGGKINLGENVRQGLDREILEELGGKILSAELIPIETFTSSNKRFIYHTYFIAVDNEFVPELNSEHVGYAWLPLSAAPKPLHPGVKRTINSAETMQKISVAESQDLVL